MRYKACETKVFPAFTGDPRGIDRMYVQVRHLAHCLRK